MYVPSSFLDRVYLVINSFISASWDTLSPVNQQAPLSTLVVNDMETKDSSSNLPYSLMFVLMFIFFKFFFLSSWNWLSFLGELLADHWSRSSVWGLWTVWDRPRVRGICTWHVSIFLSSMDWPTGNLLSRYTQVKAVHINIGQKLWMSSVSALLEKELIIQR